MLKITETDRGVSFSVHVAPRAARTEIVGVEGDALRIRIHASPVEGKANEALVELIARALHVSGSQVQILSGGHSRRKIVRVSGIKRDALSKIADVA